MSPLFSRSARHASWFERPTQADFARREETLDAFHPIVRDALARCLLPGEDIRWIICAPSSGYLPRRRKKRPFFKFNLPWEFSPERILVLTTGRLLIARCADGDQISEIVSIRLDNLFYLQTGKFLLYAWFEVHWVDDSQIKNAFIPFNATSMWMFQRLAEWIRQEITGRSNSTLSIPRKPDEILVGLPYKFKNMIPRHSLLPGECPRKVLYRPALWKKRAVFFKTVDYPSLVLVRTDLYLLLVEEDLDGVESKYGFITTFFPLSRVSQVTLGYLESEVGLTIHLDWLGMHQDIDLAYPAIPEKEITSFIAEMK